MQHPDLGFAERIYQPEGVGQPGRASRHSWLWLWREQATDLGHQSGLLTAIKGIAIEQLPGRGVKKERRERAVDLGYIERAPHGVPGSGWVTECVPGDGRQQPGVR